MKECLYRRIRALSRPDAGHVALRYLEELSRWQGIFLDDSSPHYCPFVPTMLEASFPFASTEEGAGFWDGVSFDLLAATLGAP